MTNGAENQVERLLRAIEDRDYVGLKRLSNEFIERAAMEEDENLVDLSLIAYALYKMLSKIHLREQPEWAEFLRDVELHLEEAAKDPSKASVRAILEQDILKDISELNQTFGNYVSDVVDMARIKQASRIYALGNSLAKALALTHADRYQVLQYIGDTRIHDRPFTSTVSVVDRYRMAKKALGGERE